MRFWVTLLSDIQHNIYSVLYCTILLCVVLYCTYCTILYHAVLCHIMSCHNALCCIALHCIVLYCIVLFCIVLYCIPAPYPIYEYHGTHCCHYWYNRVNKHDSILVHFSLSCGFTLLFSKSIQNSIEIEYMWPIASGPALPSLNTYVTWGPVGSIRHVMILMSLNLVNMSLLHMWHNISLRVRQLIMIN